jgi:drug/metabolite transporter (DMT)-like permease
MSPRILLVWILTCGIWSTVWLCIKIGVGDVPPVTFAAWRIAVALIVLLPLILSRRIVLPREWREIRLLTITGVLLLGVNYALLNWGIQFVSSGLSAVLQAMTPAFSLAIGHFLLPDEKVTWTKTLALALGLSGIAVIFWNQLAFGGPQALLGSLAVVGGAVCVALAYVLLKKYGTRLYPSTITTTQMLAAIVPLAGFAIVAEGNPLTVTWTPRAAAALLYLALVGSIAATWLNYWLLRRIGATLVLVTGLIEPVIAAFLGAIFLGESMNGRTLLGAAGVLLSVAFILDVRTTSTG